MFPSATLYRKARRRCHSSVRIATSSPKLIDSPAFEMCELEARGGSPWGNIPNLFLASHVLDFASRSLSKGSHSPGPRPWGAALCRNDWARLTCVNSHHLKTHCHHLAVDGMLQGGPPSWSWVPHTGTSVNRMFRRARAWYNKSC